MKLREIIERDDLPAGRAFNLFILCLIGLSLITLPISTLPDLSPRILAVLHICELAVTIAFTFEYVTRIAAARRKARYILSFYGMVDLIAILPFYLSLGVELQGLRAVRLFQVFRLFKIMRYNTALNRLHHALLHVREEILLFLLAAGMLLYFSAIGIYYFEHDAQPDAFRSVFDSLWWAVATLTTVGYGDIYPITLGGKLFTFAVLMCGLGIVAVPAGLVASALSEVRREHATTRAAEYARRRTHDDRHGPSPRE